MLTLIPTSNLPSSSPPSSGNLPSSSPPSSGNLPSSPPPSSGNIPSSSPPSSVTSPHFVPQSQATPSYPLHQAHVTTSHHVPYSQVTSPHFVSQPQITSPHIHPPPQHHLSCQNLDPGLDNPNWNKSASEVLNSFSYSCQNQATAHLDLQNQTQNQNQFCTGVTHHGHELGHTHRLPYNTHPHLASGVYGQGDTPGPGQDTWGPLEPTLSQMQCSPLGSLSGGTALGRWSSMDFSSSSTEDFSNTQFFPDSYHDSIAPQSFCSPTTPGPSPHYPHTPTISSPGPQMHPRNEMLGFHTQTSAQLNSCCLQESDSFPLSSEPSQHHPHQSSRRLLPSQTEPIQDQTGVFNSAGDLETGFSPQGGGQNVSSAAQSPSLPAGPIWREECGGGGRGDGQPDWTWMKRPQPENMKVVDCRLLCTVCKRDFRSLPALNGHMRSHSGFRSATLGKKGEDSSPPAQPSVSMVMPVSVPIQSRGASKACRSAQRRCNPLSPATGGAVLYRSLMHLDAAAAGGREAVTGGDGVVDGGRGHYTPPPMLCPLRVGAGLYCSLTTRRQQRVRTVQLHDTHNGLSDLVAMDTLTTGVNKPRINVGRGFQAEIPSLHNHKRAHSNSQDALLVWTPWDELEKPVNQQRVEALLMMVRSSVVPGGGASPEHALHALSECRGDFLLTLEKLLSSPEASNNNHTGVCWSAAEMKLLVKSLQLHHKDFSSVQRAVKTKSLSQCVEFYYLWKKKLSLSVRTPAGLTVTLPNTNRSSRSHDAT
ncbi:transcriptional-regulating factor 1-like [Seriola lalandi dorsalis]|uniref:transcriptional-regulating factor 1-like n=2 Tax=Seriola TaxID=8160 RepID=UPI000C6F8FCF|nr:transcriptional-regulating factor 1-like [Seriola lalandi dorsalis]